MCRFRTLFSHLLYSLHQLQEDMGPSKSIIARFSLRFTNQVDDLGIKIKYLIYIFFYKTKFIECVYVKLAIDCKIN